MHTEDTKPASAGTVATTVRLPPGLHQQVAEAAWAARLPRAAFVAEVLAAAMAAGHYPGPAPAGAIEPSLAGPAGQALGRVLQRLAGNLTQVRRAAARADAPLARLAQQGGEMERWHAQAGELADRLRSGELDEPAAARALEELDAAGHQLNDLAARLNAGEVLPLAAWAGPLQAVRQALEGLARG